MTVTAHSTFDLVAVAPAHTDRRALSQAWYDALHVAERAAGAPGAAQAAAMPPRLSRRTNAERTRRAMLHGTGSPGAAPAPPVRMPKPVVAGAACGPRSERRLPVCALAQRIAVKLRGRPAAVSFTLTTPRGRVHVCVRNAGGAVRLFALCRPALLDEVESALAQARFMLAGNGVRVGW